MAVASCDTLPICGVTNLYRTTAIHGAAITELSLRIVPPGPKSAVGANGENMCRARDDLRLDCGGWRSVTAAASPAAASPTCLKQEERTHHQEQ